MGARLLIVDDEEVLCQSLKRVFLKEGYEVECVYCSEEALQLIREKPFDVIITDMILPDMGGIDLVKLCKKYNPNLIVIIMTAYASIDSVVKSIKTGAVEYLVKPIDHEEIKSVIRKLLSNTNVSQTIAPNRPPDSFRNI